MMEGLHLVRFILEAGSGVGGFHCIRLSGALISNFPEKLKSFPPSAEGTWKKCAGQCRNECVRIAGL
jgi:hypothetical protein